MASEDRFKHRIRKGRKHNIIVRGKQRKNIDVDLLAHVLIEMGRQLQRQHNFFDWLMEQDERVSAGTLLGFRNSVVSLDPLVFAMFEGGRLVCCLPPDELKEALKLPGAELWASRGGELIYERWARLPEDCELYTWEHYGLAAMQYAIDWLADIDESASEGLKEI